MGRLEARMGVHLLGRAKLRSVGCGGHLWEQLCLSSRQFIYALDQSLKLPSELILDFGPEHKCSDGLLVKAVPTILMKVVQL